MSQALQILFVGGGLANVLAALRLNEMRPDVRWLLLEATAMTGGAAFPRTWSFHESDLSPDLAWAGALANHRWSGYRVEFSTLTREIDGGYASLRSTALDRLVKSRLQGNLRFETPVAAVASGRVTLADGEVLTADLVVDGRGLTSTTHMPSGFQKFLGLNLKLTQPHGLSRPILMDATVSQNDGFHFVYVLPWSETELLVEDTYYGTDANLALGLMEMRLRDYVSSKGWSVASEGEREHGVLPIPLAGDYEPTLPRGVAMSGVAAGRFHPTTGYSFAYAARLADRLASFQTFNARVADEINGESLAIWQQGDFLRRLNNMLFLAAKPDERWQIMAQFYGRDLDLIRRFYRGDLRRRDQFRLMSGRPPIAITKGLKAFVERHGSTHA